MKKLLSLLMIFVFLNTHAFALSGGPKYDDVSNVDIVGTYTGVLIPTDPTQSTVVSQTGESINSLGIFALGVPQAGPATGSFLAFTNGLIFAGTITAVGDPSSGDLNGLISATYSYNLQTYNDEGDLVSTPLTAQVSGILQAKIEASDFNPTSLQSILLSLQRIEGTAQMAVNLAKVDIVTGQFIIDRILNFDVSGVKQSSTVATTSLDSGIL